MTHSSSIAVVLISHESFMSTGLKCPQVNLLWHTQTQILVPGTAFPQCFVRKVIFWLIHHPQS